MIDPLASRDIPEIERIAPPSLERFEAVYQRAGRPFVMRLPTESAPLDLMSLRTRFGDLSVSALPTEGGVLRGTRKEATAFHVVRLGDMLDAVIAGRDPGYQVSTPLADLPRELAHALGRLPDYDRGARFSQSRLWLAVAGTVTPLHFDLAHNLLRPLSGRRRVLLYPPLDGVLLEPQGPASKMANFASFDPEREDRRRLPLSRWARPVRTVLSAGDALYIPPGYWHHVRTVELSLAVNTWWGKGALAQLWRAAQVWKKARGAFRGEWTRPA